LEAAALPELFRAIQNDRRLLVPLLGILTEPRDLVRWRAIEVLGQVTAHDAREDPDRAKETVRRLLWSMNEESGGNLRHGPEALGEILACVPALAEEYLGMLVALADEVFFRPAVMWGVARIAVTHSSLVAEYKETLDNAVRDSAPYVRLWAAVALRALGLPPEAPELASVVADATPVEFYSRCSGHTMQAVTIAEAVSGEPTLLF